MLKQMQTQRRADSRPPLPHQDEFPAEYSLAGCSPAEPASASSAMLILNQTSTAGYCFSANGNCPRTRLSHLTTQATGPSLRLPTDSSVTRVESKDGVFIAIECAGAGPNFVIVHGGTGDRRRWTPLFPLLISNFRVCAMDRRGHGASGDSSDYTLQKEAEDVAAVVNSRGGPVFVLGYS